MFLLIVLLFCAQIAGKSCEINISDCNASIFGDCLLGYTVNPWINCTHSSFCWKAFSDGVCNEICNTKECLFDGMDCLNKQKNAGPNNKYIVDKNELPNQDIRLNGKRRQCDPEFDAYCQRNYQNGYCDQGCNNEQCGWDGLDCLEANQRNNIKQFNYAELPYVARGSLLITVDVPMNRLLIAENGQKGSAKAVEGIFALLRVLSQIVGTTLRVKQNYNDGSFVMRPIRGENGENMTEIEVIADNRLCEYDCFDSAIQMAHYLAAYEARTKELAYQFGQSSKFTLKSIRATEEAESLVASKYPKSGDEPTSVTTWILTCVVVVFIGLLLGVLISNKERRVSTGITWFPYNFKLRSEESCRSIATCDAAGGNYQRKHVNKMRGLKETDRYGEDPEKAWHPGMLENKEQTNSSVIYEEPKDTRSWSMQHYEAYGNEKNKNPNSIIMPFTMPNLKEILHPGLRQTQNVIMQTEANTEPMMANGLLSPPLMNTLNGDVDVVGPSGLTPLMVAAAFRGATPYCGVGDDLKNNESTKLLDGNAIELMDTHNGPGSAGSQTSTNGNSMIDDLISQGASVDKKMENTGETSLHLAARFCRADAVKRLLEAKADCNAQDFKGRTPLHTAIAADACGAFEILIRNRATSLNAKSNDGNTPLILAVRNCADSMMNELLSAGADINATDNAQRTALHWAAMVSNLTGLKALIEHGANKDAQDEKEQTPLFLATREGAYECVQALLEAGANKDIADHMDVSPRKIAETKKHNDILALLDSDIKPTIQNTASNGDQVPSSPKKPLNSSNNEPTTNTAKRVKKQATKPQQQQQQPQTQTKFIAQQPLNATELLQQAQIQQAANVQTNYMQNNAVNTLKKGQQISSNPNSALNQVPPPLPPPRPQLQPVPIKAQKNQTVVNLPPIQTNNQQFDQQLMQQNYNQNLPSPFDHMMHTPLTPTTTTANNPMMNPINHPMPNTPNSITNINSPQMTNHVLLSPNNTVLMSPPHHSNVMNQIMQPAHPYYLGKPPPYESINHCTQQISNATYMATVTQMQPATQWTAKQQQQESNYYTIFNSNTNNKNNDASYLTPSPDSPGNWSATTSPASNGDWLELQTPAQQQQTQMHNDNASMQLVNSANNENLQLALVDQSQLSPAEQQMNHDQMQQQQQIDMNPPTYQASCNQQLDQQQAPANANTRQITSTQQAVFL